MAIQPDGGDWSQWLTLVFSVAVSALTSVGIGGFFVGSTKKELDLLKTQTESSEEDRANLWREMRNLARGADITRLDLHLARQDESILQILLNLRNGKNGAP